MMEQEKKESQCPCLSKDCPRNLKCEECKEYHHARGSKTSCGK